MGMLLKTLMGLLVFLVCFCFFGIYMSYQSAKIRSERCAEIDGRRVPGKYNGGSCLVNGRVVLIDYDDYREQAASFKKGHD